MTSRAPANGKKCGVCLLLALTRPFLDGTPRLKTWLADIFRFLHCTAQYRKKGKRRESGDEGGKR